MLQNLAIELYTNEDSVDKLYIHYTQKTSLWSLFQMIKLVDDVMITHNDATTHHRYIQVSAFAELSQDKPVIKLANECLLLSYGLSLHTLPFNLSKEFKNNILSYCCGTKKDDSVCNLLSKYFALLVKKTALELSSSKDTSNIDACLQHSLIKFDVPIKLDFE